LLILINLFHILYSPVEKSLPTFTSAGVLHQLYFSYMYMVMSRANRAATHDGAAFLGHEVGREIWLRKNVCLFWRLYLCLCGRLCAHMFLSVFA